MIVKLVNRSTRVLKKVYNRLILDQSLCALCGATCRQVDQGTSTTEHSTLGHPTISAPAPSYALPVCSGCLHWLAPIKTPCVQCALPLSKVGTLCGQCISTAPVFDQIVAGCLYQGPIQTLAWRQKQGHPSALKPLLYALEQALTPTWSHYAIHHQHPFNTQAAINAANPIMLFPIPTPWNRWLLRGFNPTHEIAWQLPERVLTPWSIPYQIHWRALQAKPHPPQKQQTYRQRLALTKRLFAWQKPQDLSGKYCVLIDDVMTTGATLNACAALLKQQGAAQVDAWVLCRTPKKTAC